MSTEWIAVDWGTSNLRVWVMGENGPLTELNSEQGMNGLTPDAFESVLLNLVESYLGATKIAVICCGMVGARQGWKEAAYASVPCPPPGVEQSVRVTVCDPRLDVHILPGIKQLTPPDVMRGEETQIAGFLKLNPQFDGVLCLPGTHTKWVQISAGEIVSFRTVMTGELFGLLSTQSVLKHSVQTEGFDSAAFDTAVGDALARPEALAQRLFTLRAGSLIAGVEAATARGQLSGFLIGAELAAMRPYWLGQNLALIGDAVLSAHYARALELQGIQAAVADAPAMTLAGLSAAYESLMENNA